MTRPAGAELGQVQFKRLDLTHDEAERVSLRYYAMAVI
jgi:hypothetical protein